MVCLYSRLCSMVINPLKYTRVISHTGLPNMVWQMIQKPQTQGANLVGMVGVKHWTLTQPVLLIEQTPDKMEENIVRSRLSDVHIPDNVSISEFVLGAAKALK